MSMVYWGIVGYGINLDDISEYLNKDNVVKEVKRLNPNIEFSDDIFDDDTFYGYPYNYFVEFLCELDDKHIMSFDTDGESTEYFLYPPSYPWQRNKYEPKDEIEVHDHIIEILQKVYDASYEELSKHIEYISSWGCG